MYQTFTAKKEEICFVKDKKLIALIFINRLNCNKTIQKKGKIWYFEKMPYLCINKTTKINYKK